MNRFLIIFVAEKKSDGDKAQKDSHRCVVAWKGWSALDGV